MEPFILNLGETLKHARGYDISALGENLDPLLAVMLRPDFHLKSVAATDSDAREPKHANIATSQLPTRELGPFLAQHPGLVVPHALAEAIMKRLEWSSLVSTHWIRRTGLLRNQTDAVQLFGDKRAVSCRMQKRAEELEGRLGGILRAGRETISIGLALCLLTTIKDAQDLNNPQSQALGEACNQAARIFIRRCGTDAHLASIGLWGALSDHGRMFLRKPWVDNSLELLMDRDGIGILDRAIRIGLVELEEGGAAGMRNQASEGLGPKALWSIGEPHASQNLLYPDIERGGPTLMQTLADAEQFIENIHRPLPAVRGLPRHGGLSFSLPPSPRPGKLAPHPSQPTEVPMLNLRGVLFKRVWNASGARGFDGAWPFHKLPLVRRLGLDFTGATMQTKTATLKPRKGHMPVQPDGITPSQWKPDCVRVYPWRGYALNAVGLTNPGLEELLRRGYWNDWSLPFVISFMSTEATPEQRLAELEEAIDLLDLYRSAFRAPFALSINASCPNVGLDPGVLVEESERTFEIASRLAAPVVYKINSLVPVPVAAKIAQHPACDAICDGNSLPWGSLPDEIDWKKLFGSETSPLAHLETKGGGLSGKPLFPIVLRRIREAKRIGFPKPIIACGGILDAEDAVLLRREGAAAVEIGSAAFLRFWRIRSIVRAVLAEDERMGRRA